MINDNENILDINTFTKLLKTIQNLSNFESYKTLFLYGPYYSKKKKHILY